MDRNILLLGFVWLVIGTLIFVLILIDQPEVVIEWQTESEFETVGFNLWRKITTQDEFKKINNQLIPGSSDPTSGGSYKYIDTDIDRGITYYYQLEDINYDGTSTQHEEFTIEVPQTNPVLFILASFCMAVGLLLFVLKLVGKRRANRN